MFDPDYTKEYQRNKSLHVLYLQMLESKDGQ